MLTYTTRALLLEVERTLPAADSHACVKALYADIEQEGMDALEDVLNIIEDDTALVRGINRHLMAWN